MGQQDSSSDTLDRLGPYQLLGPLSDSYFGRRVRLGGGTHDGPRAARLITTDAPERFASAASAIRGVEHPSLLSPLELVRPGRGLAVVTENIPGETLSTLLQRSIQRGESIPESIALRSSIDLLEALQALECADGRTRRGSHLHGGLTPDSVLVGADGRTRLIDPGIAAAAAREPRFARDPLRAAYSAPEHADGLVGFDARSDVFSLGAALWEVLACRSLFGADSYEAVLRRVMSPRVARIQRERFLRGEPVSAALAAVVDHALQRDPERRFQSYEELLEALRGAGRVAAHDEVASFLAGGMRSLRAAVESVPAPGRAPESGPAAKPAAKPAVAARVEAPSPPPPLVLEPPPPPVLPPRVFPRSSEPAPGDGFVVSDLERAEPGRSRRVVQLLLALTILVILGLVAMRGGDAAQKDAAVRASAGGGAATEATDPASPSSSPSQTNAATHPARKHVSPLTQVPPTAPANVALAPAPAAEPSAAPPVVEVPPPAPHKRLEQLRPRRRAPVSAPLHEYIPDDI